MLPVRLDAGLQAEGDELLACLSCLQAIPVSALRAG